MSDLIKYDAMCQAIAECHRVDEVKDLRDKAMALELYAKQARNTDAERKASEVRLRAERRTGELLKDLARTAPQDRSSGRPVNTSNDATNFQVGIATECHVEPSPYSKALADTGMSRQTASRYQALANVPQPVFEEALRDPEIKPTTTRLIQQARAPQPKMPDDSLWIWGRLRDLERDGYFRKDPAVLMSPMTESMQADMRRLMPLAVDFFRHFEEVISHEHA